MTTTELPTSEDYAPVFGDWKVWFEWGGATVADPVRGIQPAWFARRGRAARETVAAIDLTGTRLRSWLREFLDEPTVWEAWRGFEPQIAKTSVGSVLTPRPSR